MERIFLLRLWKSWCIELFVWFCSSLKDEKFNLDDFNFLFNDLVIMKKKNRERYLLKFNQIGFT